MRHLTPQQIAEREAWIQKTSDAIAKSEPHREEMKAKINAEEEAKKAQARSVAFKEKFPQELKNRKEHAKDVAAWMLENWFDPVDRVAKWYGKEGEEHWYAARSPLTLNTIIHCFTDPSAWSPIGAYFIDAENTVKHICLDIDAHKTGQDAEVPLRRATELLDRVEFPYTVARSKGGKGYHLRIYFDKPLPAHVGRNLGLEIVKTAGLPPDTEVNPKQNELRVGECGNQVAIPGSLHFLRKSRGVGSTLVDPKTLNPIPFRDWFEYLRSVPPLTEKTLREIGEKTGTDLWKKYERPSTTFNPDDFECEGVPQFTTVEQVVGFLSKHGIEVEKARGAYGDWTDRLLLLECPNAEAHGSIRSDGAAVLFNSETGRVGYKCWHQGCNDFSWPKFLKKLGYKFKRVYRHEDYDSDPPPDFEPTPPSSDYLETVPDAELPAGIVDPEEKEKEQSRAGAGFTHTEKAPLVAYGRTYEEYSGDEKKKRKLIVDVGRCRIIRTEDSCINKECEKYGKKSIGRIRCNNRACPSCAAYDWRSALRPFAEIEWKLPEYYVTKVPVEGGPFAVQRERERIMKLYRKNVPSSPRWFAGFDHVLFIFDSVDAPYAREFKLPEGEILSKSATLDQVGRTWLSEVFLIRDRTRECGSFLQAINENPWIMKANRHRTGAGGRMKELTPWTTPAKEREAARKLRLDLDPDYNPCECESCKKLKLRRYYLDPTNTFLGARKGIVRKEVIVQMSEPAESAWIVQSLSFTV